MDARHAHLFESQSTRSRVNAFGLVIAALFLVAALAVVWKCQTWTVNRLTSKLPAAFRPMQTPSRLIPESKYIVEVSGDAVRCTHPDGTVESLEWVKLRKVELVTTDEGPFVPDLFWVLHGMADERVVIPLHATGDKALLEHLQRLPGFHSDIITQAMRLTSNNRFVCWQAAEPFAAN